jgi:hypothetical protein
MIFYIYRKRKYNKLTIKKLSLQSLIRIIKKKSLYIVKKLLLNSRRKKLRLFLKEYR